MFQIDGRDLLFDWLSRETDSQRRQITLDWFVEFAKDPLRGAERVPSIKAPVYVISVPPRPPVIVTFLYAFHFSTLKLLKIEPMV